jgi:hypothetical protein
MSDKFKGTGYAPIKVGAVNGQSGILARAVNGNDEFSTSLLE